MTIVQRPRHLMNPFDADGYALIHQRCALTCIWHWAVPWEDSKNATGASAFLWPGKPLRADMVVLAIGVTPDTTLAEAART